MCIFYVSRGTVGAVAQRQDEPGAGAKESKAQAEIADVGCTAGLQPQWESGAQTYRQLKHQGQGVHEATIQSSTAIIGQGKQ